MRTSNILMAIASAGLGLLLATVPSSAQGCSATDTLFDYPDTALSGMPSAQFTKPIDDCRRICSERSGCAGFDHSDKDGTCRIFSSIGGGRADAQSNAGTRALISGYGDPANPPLAAKLEKLKQQDQSGDGLFDLALEAFQRCDKAVGMEAMNLAVQRGSAKAKLEVARWYDPRTFASDRVAGIDANRAARAYFELALEGNSEAGALLSSLCREADNSSSPHAAAFDNFLRSTYCEGSISP